MDGRAVLYMWLLIDVALLEIVLDIDRLQALEIMSSYTIAAQFSLKVFVAGGRLLNHALDDPVDLIAIRPGVVKVEALFAVVDEDFVLDCRDVIQMSGDLQ